MVDMTSTINATAMYVDKRAIMVCMGAGGARENAGRKDAYGGKDAAPVAMVFTPQGDQIMVETCERTGLSRNDVLTHLALKHARALKFSVEGVVYRGKDYRAVRSIRVTQKARKLLDAARERTGKSYSDLGEALLVRFAASTRDYPEPYASKASTRRRTQGKPKAKTKHGRK